MADKPVYDMDNQPSPTGSDCTYLTRDTGGGIWADFKLTLANLYALFKASFDLVYAAIGHTHVHATTTSKDADDHTQYLLATGTRAGSTSQAQSFGATGIKADVIAEDTGAAGVTVDGLKIKDAGIALGSDADGDIYYRASGALARLAKGSALQVLRMNSGATAPEYAYPAEYVALIKPAGNQTISASTATKVTLDSETLDRGSAFASNKFTVAANKGGVYIITYQGNLASLASGKTFNVYLYKNGGSEVFLEMTVGAAGNIALAGCKMLNLSATDYIELYVWHNDTVDRTLLAAGTYLNIAGPF